MKRRPLQRLIGGIAVVALLLLAGALAYSLHYRVPAEDRVAEDFLSTMSRQRSRGISPSEVKTNPPVPVPALVRVMVRPDSAFTRLYRKTWDNLPSWLKRHCPRPLDERTRGVLVRMYLMNHENQADALPVLAAALTNPHSGNRTAALALFHDVGIWVPDTIVEPALKGLQDTNAAVQLQVLESLQKVWPTQPDLARRIDEMRHEAKP